jgi:hypothetical protein
MQAMPEDEAMLYLACPPMHMAIEQLDLQEQGVGHCPMGSRGNLQHLARWLLAETAATANHSCTRAGAGAGAVPHPVRAPPHRLFAGCG